jgi:hypothetical protein
MPFRRAAMIVSSILFVFPCPRAYNLVRFKYRNAGVFRHHRRD